MQRNAFLTTAAAVIIFLSCFAHQVAQAQSDETKKFEVGAHFSALSLDDGAATRTEPGFGGRLAYNVTDNFALEAEGNFFPQRNRFHAFLNGGQAVEGLFGVKIGKRFKRLGLFGKARPGFIRFSQGRTEFNITGPTTDPFSITLRTRPLTHFATDIGGVLEFYPSPRIITRFDIGDTIIRYGQMTFTSITSTPGGTFVPLPVIFSSNTTHNFQFS
ncbi:MAG TPA: outer membrane beta-barrel protein, partial [Pyrinomonadaceae bacterium]